MPRTIPLTNVWKKEYIKKRMVLEKNRGFGKGIVLERVEVSDGGDGQVKDNKREEKGEGSSTYAPGSFMVSKETDYEKL